MKSKQARFSCQIIGKTLPPSIIEEKEFTELDSTENTVKTTFRSMDSKGIYLPEMLMEILACCHSLAPFNEKATIPLNILGTGELWLPTQTWKFDGLFPIYVNFGDLGYSTSDEYFIEVAWKYTSKEKNEQNVSVDIDGRGQIRMQSDRDVPASDHS